MKKSIRP